MPEAFQLGTVHVQEYNASVMMLVQQKGSRLRRAVRVEGMNSRAQFFEQLGPTTTTRRTTRHADSPVIDSDFDRRQVTANRDDWGDLIDEPDRVRIMISPSGPMARNAAWAHGRTIDQNIIDAAFGTAVTKGGGGEEASANVVFPAGQTIAATFGGAGGQQNLTLDKIREASRLLNAAEVDEDGRFFVTTADGLFSLLHDPEVTSSDFAIIKALVNGEVNSYMGFEFIRTELLPANRSGSGVATDISNIAYQREGILLGINQDITTRMEPRADKNFSLYVHVTADTGATRMEELRVVEVLADSAGVVSGG